MEGGIPMTTRGERNVGLSLAAAGLGVIGVAVVFGLTTDSGGPDWIGIITLAAGALMAITGLFTAFRNRGPHTA
jgi:hypothetical protein